MFYGRRKLLIEVLFVKPARLDRKLHVKCHPSNDFVHHPLHHHHYPQLNNSVSLLLMFYSTAPPPVPDISIHHSRSHSPVSRMTLDPKPQTRNGQFSPTDPSRPFPLLPPPPQIHPLPQGRSTIILQDNLSLNSCLSLQVIPLHNLPPCNPPAAQNYQNSQTKTIRKKSLQHWRNKLGFSNKLSAFSSINNLEPACLLVSVPFSGISIDLLDPPPSDISYFELVFFAYGDFIHCIIMFNFGF